MLIFQHCATSEGGVRAPTLRLGYRIEFGFEYGFHVNVYAVPLPPVNEPSGIVALGISAQSMSRDESPGEAGTTRP